MTIPLRLRWELAVRANEALSPTAKLLAYTIKTYMDADGECFVGVPRLARDMGVTHRTVQRARCELETAGLLVVDGRSGHSNIYRLSFDWATPTSPGDDARVTTPVTPTSPITRHVNPSYEHESETQAFEVCDDIPF